MKRGSPSPDANRTVSSPGVSGRDDERGPDDVAPEHGRSAPGLDWQSWNDVAFNGIGSPGTEESDTGIPSVARPRSTETSQEDRIVEVVREVVRAEASELRSEMRQLQGWMASVVLDRIDQLAAADQQFRERLAHVAKQAESWIAENRDATNDRLDQLIETHDPDHASKMSGELALLREELLTIRSEVAAAMQEAVGQLRQTLQDAEETFERRLAEMARAEDERWRALRTALSELREALQGSQALAAAQQEEAELLDQAMRMLQQSVAEQHAELLDALVRHRRSSSALLTKQLRPLVDAIPDLVDDAARSNEQASLRRIEAAVAKIRRSLQEVGGAEPPGKDSRSRRVRG